MDFLEPQKQISSIYLVGLSVAILFGILIFGLRPKGFNFSNGVNWITDQPGIRFSKYGIAYTNPFFELIGDNISKPNCFSIEIALRPASYQENKANFILSLHDGMDRNQLLMWQYHSWIILMNGDDYDHKRRTKRIAVDIASLSPKTRFVTVTTGEEGTEVYLDGQSVIRKRDLTLKIPNGGKTRLLLGNSVYGKQPWRGDIYGLAFYGHALTAQDAAFHFDRWVQVHNFTFAKKEKPFVLYVFDEKVGERALDQAVGNNHLKIPSRIHILEKKILSSAWTTFKFKRIFIQDIIINFVGFIPFGFFLTATLIKLGGAFEKHDVLIAVSFCFAVSLIIEIFQAWIPSRHSEMLDLILNTFGALIGAIMVRFFILRINRKRSLLSSVGGGPHPNTNTM
ncbi:MAG TPA: VanZ family protein [Desulfobacterales bacterium]|nr:VanZ family protein [Desulfobacterales bacterium]